MGNSFNWWIYKLGLWGIGDRSLESLILVTLLNNWSNAICISALANIAPTQWWAPDPKAKCLPTSDLVILKTSGSKNTFSSRLNEAYLTSKTLPLGILIPLISVSHVTVLKSPWTGVSNLITSSTKFGIKSLLFWLHRVKRSAMSFAGLSEFLYT